MLKRNAFIPAGLADQQFIRTTTIPKCLTANKALLLLRFELRKITLLFQNPAEFSAQKIIYTIISSLKRSPYN